MIHNYYQKSNAIFGRTSNDNKKLTSNTGSSNSHLDHHRHVKDENNIIFDPDKDRAIAIRSELVRKHFNSIMAGYSTPGQVYELQ